MWRTRQLVLKTNLQHLHLLSSSTQAQEGKKNKIWRAQPVMSVIWCLVLTQLRDTTATFRVPAVWLHLLCPLSVRVGMMLVRGLLPSVLPPSHPTNFSQSHVPPITLLPRNPVVLTHQPIFYTNQPTSSAHVPWSVYFPILPSVLTRSSHKPTKCDCSVDNLGHFLHLKWPLCLVKSHPAFPWVQLKSLTIPAPSLQWISAPSFTSSFDSDTQLCMTNHIGPEVFKGRGKCSNGNS